MSLAQQQASVASLDQAALVAADFLPAAAQAAVDDLATQAAPTYWSRVWARLRANPRALLALALILLLSLFTLCGPLLWTLDPASQNPSLVSRGPMAASVARLVVEDGWAAAHCEPASSGAAERLTAREANTERVRLVWPPQPDASHYRLYRHDREPRSAQDLGLPLAAIARCGYEDRLALRQQPYMYTLLAMDGERELARFQLRVQPVQAIALLDAQLQGLLALDALVETGRPHDIRLPAHPLGTDALGRDLLARLMHGARVSLYIGIVAPLLFTLLGVLYGAAAGLLGGALDNLLMRFAEFVVALPFLLFMIVLKIAFGIGPGDSGIHAMLVALVLLSWPGAARLVRAQILQLRELAFVDAARLSGASSFYLLWRHMLPNVLGVILVSLSFAIPHAIFTEAFLSFIGMGVVAPTPSWGAMSHEGVKSLLSHPQELLWPSLLISITVLAFNLLGDALRDALDMRMETVQ